MLLFVRGLEGLKIFSSSSSSVSDLVLAVVSRLRLNPIVMAACCNFISIPPFLLLVIVWEGLYNSLGENLLALIL